MRYVFVNPVNINNTIYPGWISQKEVWVSPPPGNHPDPCIYT